MQFIVEVEADDKLSFLSLMTEKRGRHLLCVPKILNTFFSTRASWLDFVLISVVS